MCTLAALEFALLATIHTSFSLLLVIYLFTGLWFLLYLNVKIDSHTIVQSKSNSINPQSLNICITF